MNRDEIDLYEFTIKNKCTEEECQKLYTYYLAMKLRGIEHYIDILLRLKRTK